MQLRQSSPWDPCLGLQKPQTTFECFKCSVSYSQTFHRLLHIEFASVRTERYSRIREDFRLDDRNFLSL